MRGRMLAMAVMLFLCWTAPVLAETPAGAATYRVTIVLYPGDDPAAVAKRLAAMYRGTLETPVDGNGSFTISLSDAGAGLMRRDPMVAEMDSPSLALPAATTSGSATAALPVSQRPVETNATTSWSLGAYQYDGSGNIRKIGSEFYVYDQLGRIVVSADAQPSVVHKQTYTYDSYGNLRSINTAGRGATTLVMSGVSNRLASVSSGSVSAPVGYDGSGNFVSYLGATYEYDALNMMRKSVAGGVTRSYVYTASDERIGTIEQTGSTVRSDWTIRDSAGKVLRRYSKESTGEWKWQEDYIYRGTQMLAAEVPDHPKTRHFHLDHLGTPRLITGNGGAEISRHTYHPFGEEIAPSSTPREKKQFTGHERDSESLDYMHARFYAPFMGRFLSVDPYLDLRKATGYPQNWNRYSYVRNNPINLVDPDGRDDVNIGPDFEVAGAPGSPEKHKEVLKSFGEGSLGIVSLAITTVFLDAGPEMGDGELPKANRPYQRPSGATTPQQRASVQNQPCAVCGTDDGGKRVAGHKQALVQEHYQTGTIDKKKMRALDAVRPECPTCSAREGAAMSRYSRMMKEALKELWKRLL
jgi:RHS repeat-associated protein